MIALAYLLSVAVGIGVLAVALRHRPAPATAPFLTRRQTTDKDAAMDAITREGVRAYYRLIKATAAATADPWHPGANETLTNAAYEANAALSAAGLLARPTHELMALVREEFPGYNPAA
ncbi:hypothetical protein I6J42_00020 (plasmid) [Streptomyces californicus]|uniref:Secreted protein n=3 Tax=Streptomyces TaxID=1883 RepID=A0ABD7CRK0_9ACTN|nr:hypothetical protein [Streptomyces californicus]QRV32572.1 hypothetical protein I6J42_00020 [Streptomyces californicus]QRV52495.1 hypothetical protein I6J43_33655 [Streptomyces californicus]